METKIININRNILWAKVWAIAAMQGAITLCWTIYKLYLPLLLTEVGIAKEVATAVLILENALETFIEPIFGALSDRQQQIFGSKLPVISLGVILSSALLVAIPALTIFSNDNDLLQWFFIVSIIAWASVMAIFRSPAMSMLGRCANSEVLPQAASLLTLTGGVIGAFRFDVYGIIVNLGAGFAFTIGSLTLLGAAAWLRWANPPEPAIALEDNTARISIPKLCLVFMTGFTVGWGLRLLIPTVNKVLTAELGDSYTKLAMTLFFVVLGLAALPAGQIASKLGNSKGMIVGAMGTIVVLLTLLVLPDGIIRIVAIALIALLFSLVLNGAIPFALSQVPQSRGGLGVGMYFGGFGGGISLFDFLGTKLSELNFNHGVIACSIAFLLAIVWIAIASNIDNEK